MSALMKEHGEFDHNGQSLRVVEFLERRYPQFPGLNLTFEVREGITKHSAHWNPDKVPPDLAPTDQPVLEAQMIDLVDEIAYNNHDVDDGLFSEMISIDQLNTVVLWKEANKKVLQKFSNLSYPATKYLTISSMITLLVDDLIQETEKQVRKGGVQSSQEVKKSKHSFAAYSKEMSQMNQELKKFLMEKMYSHTRVIRMEEKAKRILT